MVAPNDNLLCKQAKNFYYNYVMDDGKDEIPVEMIEHMNLCPYCKSGMDEFQSRLAAIGQNDDAESERDEITFENLELHYNYINEPVSCNVVKAFLPSLADPALAVHVPTPITAHIDNCKQCADDLEVIHNFGLSHKQLCLLSQFYADSKASNSLKKLDESLIDSKSQTEIQGFHDKIHGILKRKESNVVTIFKADESVQEGASLPISVEVLDKDKISSVQSDKAPLRFKPVFAKVAAVAAILVAAFLASQVSVLQAVDLNQIYKALAKVKNVHIVKYDSETPEPMKEIWISQSLKVKISKTSVRDVLWDFNTKELKTNEIATDSIKIKEIDNKIIDEVESTMHTPWNLLPFTSTADIPKDAVWQQVKDGNVSNIDVYELSLSRSDIPGFPVHYKWRIQVDTQTHLPQKIEVLERHAKEDEYEFITTLVIDYPDNDQIQQVIEQAGF